MHDVEKFKFKSKKENLIAVCPGIYTKLSCLCNTVSHKSELIIHRL